MKLILNKGEFILKKVFAKTMIIFLCCIMLFGLLPFSAMALTEGTGSEADPFVVSDYYVLRSLMANAPWDGTTTYISLGADILCEDIQNDYSLTLTKSGQNVVLDLAGHSITRSSKVTVDKSVIRAKNGVLTIKDSVGSGAVIAKGKIEQAVAMFSTGLLEPDGGTINIYGGTYYSESYNNIAVYNECGDLYIFGGTFKAIGHGYGIFAAAGRTVIYGGTFCADDYEDSRSVYLGTDQLISIYNLTAFGMIDSNSIQNNIWQYLHSTGKIFVDGVELTDKSKTDEIAGNVIEFRTELLDKIEVFVDEPIEGKEITKKAYTSANAKYEIVTQYGENDVFWFEGEAFAEGTFEKNTAYRVRVYVRVNIPVMPDISAEVNGNEAFLEFRLQAMEGHSFYWIEYTFPKIEDPVLERVDININSPVGGMVINGGTIGSTDKFNVAADWHTSPGVILEDGYGNLNGKNAPFGTTCYATIYINANGIYKFDSNTTVVINGQEYDFEWFISEYYPQYIMVQNVPFEISSDGAGYIIGDVDGDGDVDADDYITLRRIFFGMAKVEKQKNPETAFLRADINKDSTINAEDYILLKRAYFGIYKIEQ